MTHRTFARATLAGLSALTLVLSGCSNDEDKPGAPPSAGAESAGTGSAEGNSSPAEGDTTKDDSGSGSVSITVDGAPAAGDWDEPSCTDMSGNGMGGGTLISTATDAEGSLMVSVLESGQITVTLSLEGDSNQMFNNDPSSTATFENDTFTFDGVLTAKPSDVTSQVTIDLTCKA